MAIPITSFPVDARILASLLGDTTGLSNIQIIANGNPLAVDLFQGSLLNLSSGVVISTGRAAQITGSNAGDRSNLSTIFNISGTVPNGNDAISLEITFDADAVDRQLFLQYVFGSEEFLDFAGSNFNDRLTFELNGVNLARLNDGSLVEVNNLTPGADPNTFNPDYISNLSDTNPAYFQTVLDGFTVPLTLNGNLLPNASNRLVITIQDIGDGAVDSAVFLAAGSLGVRSPLPTVNVITEAPNSVNEDGVSGILYTFTRIGAIDQALSVNYQLGGTATFDTDYILGSSNQSGTVDFAPGSASVTLSVLQRVDDLVEGDETVVVNLLPASNNQYIVGTTATATGTILDEDTPLNSVSLTISPSTVQENNSSNLVYTFTRTGPTTELLQVDYNVGGTALFIDDYDFRGASFAQSSIGSITFEAGANTVFLTVDHRLDDIVEPTETIAVTLTPSRQNTQFGRGRSYTIDTPNAVVGEIIDAPPIQPRISLLVQPIIVGEDDQTSLSYIFTRTGSTTLPLTVQYFVRGTASLGEDYTVAGAESFDDTIGTVTFQAGSNTAVVDITPTPDSVTEITETVILQLDTVAGAGGGYDINTFFEVVGSIVDAATPIINVNLEPQTVDEGGLTNLFYSFSRSGSTNDALTINYNISGTATFGDDYNQTGANSFDGTLGSITFAPGNSITNLQITAAADVILDPDETIALTLADSPNYAIGSNNSRTGTILDVPPIIPATVSLALNQDSVDEDGASSLSYTFTRDGLTDQPLTVRYQITGTAIEDTDYSTLGTSIAGRAFRTFDFVAGASTFTVRVDPTPDILVEVNETVSLTLLPADLTNGIAQYIVDNSSPVAGLIIDATPSLPVIEVTLLPASANEGGQTSLVYLFTRTGSTTQPLTIDYNVDGTATFTADYNQTGANSFTNTAGSITFATNSATATLAITPTADTIVDPDETVALTLASNLNYAIGSNSTAAGTIIDVPPIVSLVVNPASVSEDGTANLLYTFTRTGLTGNSLTVTYSVGGTANPNNDYTLNSSLVGSTATVTFNAGSDTATVIVDPTSDRLIEDDETVAFTLTNAGNAQYTIGTPSAVIGTILDQDTALNDISLAVAPSQVTEDGAVNLVYTFTRTGSTTEALRVDYDFGGNATFGTDYIVTGANSLDRISSASTSISLNVGTINFAAGSDTVTVIVDPTADSIVEPDENVTLRLVASRSDTIGGGRSYNITTPSAITGTIVDATPTVSIALEPATVNEDGIISLVYTFTRTGSIATPLTTNYIVGGTATFNTDYTQTGASNFTGNTGNIQFVENSSTANLTITPIADSITESNETVILTLVDGVNSITPYRINSLNTVSGTIIEPVISVPVINITLAPISTNEGGQQNLTYTFTRTGSTGQPLTINYNVTGSAAFGADYNQTGATSFNSTSGSITFAANAAETNLIISSNADLLVEQNETISLNLLANSNYTIGVNSSAVGTIIDEPLPTVSLAVNPASVNEDGFANLIYTFTRDGSTQNPLTVTYRVDGTANPSNDYTLGASLVAATATVTFSVGANTATVFVDPTPDSLVEVDETVSFTLLPAGNSQYAIGTPSAVIGTILDQDTALNSISLAVAPSQVTEDGTANLVYTFTRTGLTTEALQVDYDFGGTATFGIDYVVTGDTSLSSISSSGIVTLNIGTVNFAAGANTATVIIDPTADSIAEPNENVTLRLVASRNEAITTTVDSCQYNITTPEAITGTIIDATPTVSVVLTPTIVNENGTTSLIYTFTRSGVSNTQPLSVNYQVGGTAGFSDDYLQTGAATFTANTGTIVFAANSNTAVLSLTPVSDNVLELNETIDLTLLGAGYGSPNYVIGSPSTLTGTIIEPASVPIPIINITLAPSSINEGGQQNLTYTFSRTGSTSQPLTVNYSVGGSAAFGADYNQIGATNFDSTSGSITFAANAAEANLAIRSNADLLVEQNETIALNLVANSNYTVGVNSSVVGTIVDQPVPTVSLAVNPAGVNEDSAANLIYTFTRDGSTQNPLTVTYRVDGTANPSNDYALGASLAAATATVTFSIGANTATVFVDPTPDTLVEADETVSFTLLPAGNAQYAIGTSSTVTATILDQDTALNDISLAVAPSQVTEDGAANLVYTFTRTGPTTEALRVDYDFGGNATFGTDYIVTGANSLDRISSASTSISLNVGTINFAAGSDTVTVIVDPIADSIAEPDENVTLRLVASRSDTITGGGRSYNITTPSAIIGTIIEPIVEIPQVSVVLEPTSTNEDGSTANLVYVFNRTGSTAASLTATYNVGGTATFNTDYTQLGATNFTTTNGTITFLENSNTATLTIAATADAIIESEETIALTLTSPTAAYNIGTISTVTGRIVDTTSPLPVIDVTLSPASVDEGGQTGLVYLFTRTGSTTQSLTIDYNIGGTATFTADYNQTGANNFTDITGSITFAANSATATLVVTPAADAIIEPDETVTLTLASSSAYSIGTNNSASGTIRDVPVIVVTPPTVNLTVNPASVNEDSMTNLAYTFTRTGSTQDPLTVTYRVGGTANRLSGAANATSDYVLNTSVVGSIHTVTFSAGSNTTTVFASPTSDRIIEGDETVELTLVPAGSGQYTIGTTAAVVGTILDQDDNSISLTVSPSQVAEDGTENLVYTFTRTGSRTEALQVDYEFGGNAAFGTDYIVTGANSLGSISSGAVTLNIGTVNFAAGVDTAIVTVDPTADSIVEADENITLRLVPGLNDTVFGGRTYNISTPDAITGIISDVTINPTPTVNVRLEPASVNENSTTSLIYTFTRSGVANTRPLSVNYRVGGTADFIDDYLQTGAATFTTNTGTIVFAANSNTAVLSLTPVSDNVLESNETIDLTLLGAGYGNPDYVIGSPSTLTGTIIEPVVAVTNLPPTAIVFNGNASNNRFFVAENTNTTNPIRLADISITDDQLGVNTLSLSGIDANSFELIGTALFLKSGIVLDFETKTTYNLVVTVDDVTVGTTPDVTNNFTLIVTDINEPPTGVPIIPIGNTAQNTSIRIPRSTFLTGFTDTENDPLSIVNPVPNNGTIVNNNDGTFTLTPTIDFSGQIDITYGVTDGVNVLTGQLRSVIILPPENGLNFIGTTNLDVGAINNLTNGIFAVNPNNINLVGDEINLLGGANSVTVQGRSITLQPDRLNQAIQIGSADSNNPNILDLTPTDLAAITDGFSRIIIGRASGTGNIEISSNVVFRDPILLQSPGGQLNISAPIGLTDNATLDFNVRTLVKSGTSTLTINGSTATTFIGNTIINGGVLLLAKSSNTEALRDAPILINSGILQLGNNEQINNAADLTLNGGSLNLNGFNETLDRLQINSNSTINFGNGSSKLAFGNSSTVSWTGILSIENWSSTSGESIRFGNSANGLTAVQLSNIQFVGFGRGANINASGFLTPVGIAVVNPTPDQDGVSDDIEDLAPNDGDGNFDGIRDSLQENVVSILNLGTTNANNIATIVAQAGARISGLRSLANPITTANLASLANPIEFKVVGLASGASTTVEYLIAKANQNRQYNTYVMFGPTADNLTPHAYEFLYDGQTGAELFDTNGDGLTDKAVVHFVDGLRGDSDLTANGEIQDPGAPGVANTPVSLSTDANNVVQITGAAGTAIASFSLVANQTKQVSEVGFFKIDGTNKINGLAANTPGFAAAALQNGQVIFSSLADNLLSTADISRQLQLSAGDRLGFYLVRNGTVDAALQRNDFSNVVFSLDQANPAGKRALELRNETNGSYRLRWEQGSAEVNDDLILNLQLQNAPLNNQNLVAGIQGDRESELLDLSSFTGRDVQVNFTIRREAAYNDTVGFYKIEDAQGTVTSITGAKIKPGEAGYQAAVLQNRITGVDLAVANGQTASIDAVLRGGAIYAPFLIANATPDNLNGNFSNVYTSYTVGNADTTDHVRLLGDNTFGFEDLVGGGDRDFNDVVLKAVFTPT